jgi:spore germination protein GerM
MTPRQANALTAVGLAGLLATVALTAPRWAALLQAPTPATPVEGEEAEEATPAPAEVAKPEAGRRINVRLYFEAPDRDGLLPEEREVAFSSDLARQVRTVVEELAKGSMTGLLPTLPAGTRVLEVFVQARGVAYVDLSSEASSGMPGGSRAELLTVYSVVNTVVTNFPAVSRVRIVVDDRPVESLGGHVDVSRPLPPDMTLVALPTPGPSPAAGGASPAPAASPTPAR